MRGGHLRNGTNGEAANIHPLLRVDSDGDYMTDWMFDRIVDLSPKTLEPVPHLATSWDVSADGKTYTFKFNNGVKWHDGQAFSASDVEYSLKRIQAADYTGPFKPQFKHVQSVQTVDPLTLRINLSQPNASFLAASMRELKPIPEHLVQDQDLRTGAYATQLIGTGPYKFVEWKKGSSFSFAVNENYWGGRPNIDQITHNVVTDMNSLVASAEAGEIDFLIMPVPSELKRLQDEGKLNVTLLDPYIPESLYFNLTHPILKDVRVRQAIAQALDMQAFTRDIMMGVVGPAKGVVMPYLWAYEPTATMPVFNLDKSKQLMADAGQASGFSIGLASNQGNAFREAFSTYAQAQLAKINVKVDIQLNEWPVFLKRSQSFDFEMGTQAITAGYPDPDILSQAFQTNGLTNYMQYTGVDQLLDDARAAQDIAKRKELYGQVQKKVAADLPIFYTFYRPNPIVTTKKLNGLTPTALSPYYAIDKWWFAGQA